MILLRLIILLAIVALLMWLLKRLFSDPEQAQEPQRPQVTSENMRQCKYCGVHVPESSILRIDDQYYCCQEHADLDQT